MHQTTSYFTHHIAKHPHIWHSANLVTSSCSSLGYFCLIIVFSKVTLKLEHIRVNNIIILKIQIHGTIDWFKIEKGVSQDSILSPCWFNLYTQYVIWDARPDEFQARIKISGRNINNLRYADLMAENEEELKSLLMRVKEDSEKAGLKCNIKKKKLISWYLIPSLHGK